MERFDLLAHELRSPVAALAAIAAAMSAEGGRPAAETRRRLLRLAVAAGRDVDRIVTDLAPASLRREILQPGALVRDAVASVSLLGAPVRAEADRDLAQLYADPVRLRQALANLISNAVAHSPPGAEVVVMAGERDGSVEIAVSDAGEGIPLERQHAIFQEGVRFADRPGQGLGLAVARAVAEAHGGRLDVSSAPGEGATFTLVLPLAASG